MTVSEASIEAKNKVFLGGVSKHYGPVVALSNIDLAVRDGEFLTLLGPSGSGKTTLLNLIAGMISPSSGRIWIDGVDATNLQPSKRGLGMVFQNYALLPHMTVFENIAFPLRVRKISNPEIKRRVTEALEVVRLPHVAERKPSELSGGQQQRIAIARCIVYNPAIILMDEPLGALDKKLREEMQLEIKQLHVKLGITVLYVTHDQEEALTMSDRIAVMNDGKVAQVGSPEDLYDRPSDRFVAGFIGESNFLPAVVRGMEDDVVIAECDGALIRAICPGRPASGDKVTLTTRPERLRFADSAWNATTPQNRLSVTVTEAVFAGERCRYMLQAGDGTSIVLKEPSSAAIRRRAIGERAEISWSVADTILV